MTGGPLARRVARSAGDRSWLPGAALLPAMAWVLVQVWVHPPPYSPLQQPFAALTLVVHEAGHAFFLWSGSDLLTVAGGTIFQLGVPLLVAWLFARQGEWTGVAVALFWLGTALVDAGVYAADARVQELPRVSPWGGADDPLSHDWTVLLLRWGRLSRAEAIGGGLQDAGLAVMVAALAFGAWVVAILRAAGRDHAGAP